MTKTPNPDAKLREVCPELAKVIGLMNAREYNYDIPKQLWPLWEAIKARMLKLAEENEELRSDIKKMKEGARLFAQMIESKLTPASAEGGRDESNNM